MARKNDGSIIDLLFLFPWWLNAILSPVSYVFFAHHLPAMAFETVIAKGIASGFSSLSGYIAGAIALIAFIQFFKFIHRKSLIPRIANPSFLNFLFKSKNEIPLDKLKGISWREFETLVSEIYKKLGYQTFETPDGADGGIDIILLKDNEKIVVQCKHWKNQKIGVKTVRELFGVMISENADKAIIICSGSYTSDAYSFVTDKPIQLIEGQTLLAMINTVSNSPTQSLNQTEQPIITNKKNL
jgi:restriction system protein